MNAGIFNQLMELFWQLKDQHFIVKLDNSARVSEIVADVSALGRTLGAGKGSSDGAVEPSRIRRGRLSSVGYGTLRGHLIEGCECMTVTWTLPPPPCARRGPMANDSEGGVVEFELVSLSRGAGIAGRLLFPLIKNTQMRFFREQCVTMAALARDSSLRYVPPA
jgi:hypothetical protein